MRTKIDGMIADIQAAYPGVDREVAVLILRAMASIAAAGVMDDESFESAFFSRVINGMEQGELWAMRVKQAIYGEGKPK